MLRADGRAPDQLRDVRIESGIFSHADGSVLFSMGKTQVLCAVNLTKDVPSFMRGNNNSWLTAEYALLPAATNTRTTRESVSGKRQGRSVEISRLIGRVLRCVVDLEGIGEYTITVDCDVLNADGGTRCAAICGAQAALNLAVHYWLEAGIFSKSILKTQVVAVSAGSHNGTILLDLNAAEDNNIHDDFNFVLTHDNNIIEIQGTAEQKPISWQQFDEMRALAYAGVQQLCENVVQQTHPVII